MQDLLMEHAFKKNIFLKLQLTSITKAIYNHVGVLYNLYLH